MGINMKLPYGGREKDELEIFLEMIISFSPHNHNQIGRMRLTQNSNRYILKVR
jgi:hypothetical protein